MTSTLNNRDKFHKHDVTWKPDITYIYMYMYILWFIYNYIQVLHWVYMYKWMHMRFPGGSDGRESAISGREYGRPSFDPWVVKILWEK